MIRDAEIERVVQRLELGWLEARRHIQSREMARRLDAERHRKAHRNQAPSA